MFFIGFNRMFVPARGHFGSAANAKKLVKLIESIFLALAVALAFAFALALAFAVASVFTCQF